MKIDNNNTFDNNGHVNDFIADIIHCFSNEIEELHHQKRDRLQSHLQSLLYETNQKGNLAEELIHALEEHLKK